MQRRRSHGERRARASLAKPTRAALSFALAMALSAMACEVEPPTELLQVDAVSPSEVQFGDSVQIAGDGFALGNSVSVTLSGEVFQAGREPESIELALPARAESSRDLSLELPRAHEGEFCGQGVEAAHATFRGDVQVAIASRLAGAPPVVGTLHGAVLELYPAVKSPAAEASALERVRRVREFFGLEFSLASEGGLAIVALAPGGRAARADLRAGDRVVRAGGTTVLSPTDLVPEPSRWLELVVVRGGVERHVRLDADGFSAEPPPLVAAIFVPILGFGLALMAWASPLGRIGAGWVHNLREHWLARSRRPRGAGGASSSLLGDLMGMFAWLAVGAALIAPTLRRAPVDVSYGLLALMAGSATLLALSDLFAARPQRGRWSLRAGLAAAFERALIVAPVGIVIIAVALSHGLSTEEITRGQHFWPWTWSACTNPGWTLSSCLILLTTVPGSAAAARHPLPSARPARLRLHVLGESLFGWIYTCSACAWCVVAFLGNDGSGADTHAPPALGLTSALLLGKYAAAVLGVMVLRCASLRISRRSWARISARVCLPLALLALFLTQAFTALTAPSDLGRWLAENFGALSLVAMLSFAGALALAGTRRFGSARASVTLSPWL